MVEPLSRLSVIPPVENAQGMLAVKALDEKVEKLFHEIELHKQSLQDLEVSSAPHIVQKICSRHHIEPREMERLRSDGASAQAEIGKFLKDTLHRLEREIGEVYAKTVETNLSDPQFIPTPDDIEVISRRLVDLRASASNV